MTATPTEAQHFLWHCAVAAMLIDTLPANAATSSHSRNAIRLATVTAVGKNGVLHASKDAKAIKASSGKAWDKSGLVKEHVIPVSLIHERVVEALKRTPAGPGAQSFPDNPRARQVAKIVEELTLLAWISKDEEARLRDKTRDAGKSLHKRMPTGWDGQEKFARYIACEIEYSAI
jgi:hypothetical protein